MFCVADCWLEFKSIIVDVAIAPTAVPTVGAAVYWSGPAVAAAKVESIGTAAIAAEVPAVSAVDRLMAEAVTAKELPELLNDRAIRVTRMVLVALPGNTAISPAAGVNEDDAR
jgi:hypothetical protein